MRSAWHQPSWPRAARQPRSSGAATTGKHAPADGPVPFEAPRLEERASGPLAAQNRCRGEGAAPAGNRARRGVEASSRGGVVGALWWWVVVAEVVAQGGGALGAAVEADMRSSGAGAARRREGGWVRTLWARWRHETVC